MFTFRPPIIVLLSITFFFGILAWLDSPPADAQTDQDEIFQLTDAHLAPVDSYPSGFTEINGAVYFGIASDLGGLWRTDGTEAGTERVKDMVVSPYSFYKSGDFLYFTDFYGAEGTTLWRSDGTEQGTIQLLTGLEINSFQFATLHETLYFIASPPFSGAALWKTDGTPEGTEIVTDVFADGLNSSYFFMLAGPDQLYVANTNSGEAPQLWRSDGTAQGTVAITGAPESPRPLAVGGDVLYLNGSDAEHGAELWRYDPGEQSPQLLKDIWPGFDGNYIAEFASLDDQFFFVAGDGEHGDELWRSDGTPAGTQLVKDIAPGEESSFVYELTALNDRLYFAADDGVSGEELWSSDGTGAGTRLVKDLLPGVESARPRSLTVLNDELYFLAGEFGTQSLWRSNGSTDGSTNGTVRLQEIGDGYDLAAAAGALYFNAPSADGGYELWTSDGTAAGTRFVKDVDPNHWSPSIDTPVRVGNRFYFFRLPLDSFHQLWMSDGTTAPVVQISDGLQIQSWAAVGTTLFIGGYDATGAGLWRHVGGSAAPELVQRFAQREAFNLVTDGNVLYFNASDQERPRGLLYDLWRSDGTPEGTYVLVAGEQPDRILVPWTVYGNNLYASQRNQIWILDGTPSGIRSFVPEGIQGTIEMIQSTPNGLYFTATFQNPATGYPEQTLWRSDGTPAGTLQLASAETLAYIWPLEPFKTGHYFIADYLTEDGTYLRSLWYIDDGSSTMTRLAVEAFDGYRSVGWPTVVGEQIFFTYDDGLHGNELWKSDGTQAGTTLVKDIAPPELDSNPFLAYPGPLFAFGDRLLFGVHDGEHGRELWQSDGTAAGTSMLKDIYPGGSDSAPQNFVAGSDRVYFFANDGIHGNELWQSQGDAESTQLVIDLYSGSPSAHPQNSLFDNKMLYLNNLLYFTGNNGVDGEQLFALRPAGAPLALPPGEEPIQDLPHRVHLPIVPGGN